MQERYRVEAEQEPHPPPITDPANHHGSGLSTLVSTPLPSSPCAKCVCEPRVLNPAPVAVRHRTSAQNGDSAKASDLQYMHTRQESRVIMRQDTIRPIGRVCTKCTAHELPIDKVYFLSVKGKRDD